MIQESRGAPRALAVFFILQRLKEIYNKNKFVKQTTLHPNTFTKGVSSDPAGEIGGAQSDTRRPDETASIEPVRILMYNLLIAKDEMDSSVKGVDIDE